MSALPSSAKIVIVGGGIVGCAVAYHLGKMGLTDVLLLERRQLTCGSTWHAAGLVGQLRTSANITQLLGYSVDLYDRLEKETGLATGWKKNGGLRLACNPERWTEVKRQATTATSFGLEMHLLTPKEAQDLWPLMQIDDVVGAAFLPTDGQVSPSDITMSLAKGARNAGVKISDGVRVTGIEVEGGRLRAVVTNEGRIACDKLVICAGQWSRELGRMAGVNIPLVSVQHQYLITEKIDGVTPNLPTLRDPDRLTYWKEEVGGLVMGGYEPNPKPWATEGVPAGFEFQLLEDDLDHFEPLLELAVGRVPACRRPASSSSSTALKASRPTGISSSAKLLRCAAFIVGAGFNAFGIAAGGGAGMVLAEWVAKGDPPYDLWPVDIRRFGRNHLDTSWVRTRTLEAYAKHYTMAWPFEEHHSGRPLRRSPLYDKLKAQGACFGEKLGWERPNWFADLASGEKPEDIQSYERANWFDAVGREHKAARERVAVFDQTSFAKFQLIGQDAEAALSWICANDVAKPPGHLVYTQMLNDRGGIECDLTVARLSQTEYYVVTGTGFATHDFDWICALDPRWARCPPDRCHLCVCRAVGHGTSLARRLAGSDRPRPFQCRLPLWQSEANDPRRGACACAPCHLCRRAGLGAAHPGRVRRERVRCGDGRRGDTWHRQRRLPRHRVAALGEGLPLLGRGHRSRPLAAGRRPRLGREAEIEHAVSGREALTAQAARPLPRLLAGFTTNPSVILLGRETIYRDGKRVGWLTSGGYGYTVGRSIGYGYVRDPENGVDRDGLLSGRYELEVATKRVPAEIVFDPLYDPKMSRIKS